MSGDWIDNHFKEQLVESEERKKAEERSVRARRTAAMYLEDFEQILSSNIAKLNQSEEFKETIGTLELRREGYASYRIIKQVFPAIYLNVKLDDLNLHIEKTTVTVDDPRRFGQHGGATSTKSEKEILRISLDGTKLFFKTRDENVRSVDELAEYLLKQFFVKHTVFPNFPYGGDFGDNGEDNDDEDEDEDYLRYT